MTKLPDAVLPLETWADLMAEKTYMKSVEVKRRIILRYLEAVSQQAFEAGARWEREFKRLEQQNKPVIPETNTQTPVIT